MKRTIAVILSRLCAVGLVVLAVTVQGSASCQNDTECVKWAETCCRGKCRPFLKCKKEGHCLDDYNCISNNKICVKKRCTGVYMILCEQDKDCLHDENSKARGFNICCFGQCLAKCTFPRILPTVILKEDRSRTSTSKACVGRECNTNLNFTSRNYSKDSTTTPTPDASIKKNKFNDSSGSRRDFSLNPAIIAAIVIAGCIVLTITCICFLRERRLSRRKNSTRCRRHHSHMHTNNGGQPFWISRLTRNSTQTSSLARPEDASVSFTEPDSSARRLNAQCLCDESQFDLPPSYSSLSIAECPTYEEAITRHDQGTQVNLFV